MSNYTNFTNYVIDVVACDFDTWNAENPDIKYSSGIAMVAGQYKVAKDNRYVNLQEGIADWLRGLPMGFDFSDYDILRKGEEFGYDLSTVSKENDFVNNWFLRIASILIKLANKSGVSFN